MFKFGFVSQQHTEERLPINNEHSEDLTWFPSKEINSDEITNQIDDATDVDIINIGSKTLFYVKPSTILHAIKDEKSQTDKNIFLAEQSHSDLIPSKYEGGLKVWECTHDIANYLDSTEVCDKSVLDLGCGVGLLGILALQMGAHTVHFQDYNAEVLRHSTIPNVRLNAGQNQMSMCRFFSGDWESFAEQTQFTFDVVVSSETLYNPGNYLKLHNTIQRVLKPTGIAFVGAKSYYFGVGGSTRQFEKLVQARDVFNVQVVWKCSQGVQREILKLTFKNLDS